LLLLTGFYVATASVAYPVDLRRKVKKAIETQGPSYIQVNAPCITGWTFEAGNIEIVRLAVETGLWSLFEYVNGQLTEVKKVRRLKPVEDYMKSLGRYRHLFKKSGDTEVLKTDLSDS